MIEEKQTDVNLALQVYRDVLKGLCEQVVICSNDSDVEPALTLIAQDAPEVTVGLVLPLREPGPGSRQFSNKRLVNKAEWVRHYIRDEELANSQLPQHVSTKKKPASATWVLGLPHGLAVLHGKTRRGGLVFDVADLVKDATILPQAFISAMRGDTEQEFRRACIESLTRTEALDFTEN